MNKKESHQIQKRIAVYNMIPNILWSVIFLSPISVFCYYYMNLKWILIFLAISVRTLGRPNSLFMLGQLGKNLSAYEKKGILFINKFTQNGNIINQIIRKKYPDYKLISKKNTSLKKLSNQTYMFEKFHFLLFIFFMLTSTYSVLHSFYGWTVLITIGNVFYNIYPILLQQYIRLRLSSIRKKIRS